MYEVSNSNLLKPILTNKWGALFVHWVFQGLLNMDQSERAFKLALDFMGTILLLLMLNSFLPWWLSFSLAFIISHTGNFLLNAQPWTVLKHFGVSYYTEEEILKYANSIGQRATNCQSISGAGVWGGFSHGEHADPGSSDLDVRLIRTSGFIHGILGCVFVLSERTRANWNRFPLDIYLFDDMKSLSKLSPLEVPVLLLDRENKLKEIYPSSRVVSTFRWPFLIYVTGCDGVGKTTQAKLLMKQLDAKGAPARLLWLRFPFFFSLPLLAYARWRGLSWYEQTGDVRHGYWDFRGSRLLCMLLPWTLLIDAGLAGFFRIYLPLWRGETVVCERYVLDMLVDLGVAFDDVDLAQSLPCALYLRLLPRNSHVFILDADAAALRQRRPDLTVDRNLEAKLAGFRRLAEIASLPLLSASVPVDELIESIWQSFEFEDKT